ncbi:MAG: cell division protein FtsL [Candidatus Sumerlaeia bacterium]|nr:cell division protein FtsL [Candidatus Sumerlaeia bacterium]
MTRRRASNKVSHRRTTNAVAETKSIDRVASLRLTVKLVLWATFFAALFTLHAHLGLKTAALRAETRRLQGEEIRLTNARRQLLNELTEASDSARVQQIAVTQLGMVEDNRLQHMVVPQRLVREVREAQETWVHPDSQTVPGSVSAWLATLAGLWPGLENRG